jgi:NAD(P)-dependent dehydrogenase (short-subunit alcohol dehydrogenase family)
LSVRAGRLAGRNCLIIGGTSGIGLASARRFLEEGARVVVTGRTESAGAEILALLQPLGDVRATTAEVADAVAIESAVEHGIAWLGGRLDVLLHVAGISGRRFGDGPLHDCTEEGWQTVLDTNARGVFLTNRAAVRRMRTQEPDAAGLRGTVVNTGSVLGHSPSPEFFGTFAYAASKGALRAMTRTAAAFYARERIRFNLLSPALIDTPMAARAVGDPTIRAFLTTKQPLTGGPGTAEDCAEAALFLCEPASRFLTGVELTVDGGWCVAEGQIPHPIPEA